jgi:hypothetical protein
MWLLLVLDTALVTSSPWHFLFALLEADEDSLCCLMETSFEGLLHGSARGHRVGKGFGPIPAFRDQSSLQLT